jgi:hypothetical protein
MSLLGKDHTVLGSRDASTRVLRGIFPRFVKRNGLPMMLEGASVVAGCSLMVSSLRFALMVSGCSLTVPSLRFAFVVAGCSLMVSSLRLALMVSGCSLNGVEPPLCVRGGWMLADGVEPPLGAHGSALPALSSLLAAFVGIVDLCGKARGVASPLSIVMGAPLTWPGLLGFSANVSRF